MVVEIWVRAEVLAVLLSLMNTVLVLDAPATALKAPRLASLEVTLMPLVAVFEIDAWPAPHPRSRARLVTAGEEARTRRATSWGMVRDGAAARAGRVMRRRRRVTIAREHLELEETKFNGDLSYFRMVADGMESSSAMRVGKSIGVPRCDGEDKKQIRFGDDN